MPKKHDKPSHPDTEARILEAAVSEFSDRGISGARIDAIAEAAGANKALLYYYFKSKQGLYDAAIQFAIGRIQDGIYAALDPAYTPGEQLLRLVLHHFDRMMSQHELQRLMQQEMIRHMKEFSGEVRPEFFRSTYREMLLRIQKTVKRGVRSGELCAVDSMQVVYSTLGPNVFYFMSAMVMKMALSMDPLEAASLRNRRRGAVRFMANAIFADRKQGAAVAERVLRAKPMPPVNNLRWWRKSV